MNGYLVDKPFHIENQVRHLYKETRNIFIQLNGILLERTTTVKFLGSTYDQPLLGNRMSLSLKKVPTHNKIMKILNNKRYSLSSNKLLTIYKIFILLKLDYSSSIYASASKGLLQMLEPVQNSCIRLVRRAFPTSPITSLQAFTGTFSFTYHRRYLSTNYSVHFLSRLPHTKSSKRTLSQILVSQSDQFPHPPLHNIVQYGMINSVIYYNKLYAA